MTNDANSIKMLLEGMIKHQTTKVLKIARELIPNITPEDIRNPQDFPVLYKDIVFNYEDGILSGYLAIQTAINNLTKT